MGSPAPAPSLASGLIADQYAVALDHKLAGAGGGLPAFAATDRRSGRANLMAVQVQPHRPPRARALSVLAGGSPDGVLGPLAHGAIPIGPEEAGYFVVCPTPPGPALSAGLRPWPESALLDKVLRPAVLTLAALEKRGVTHRSIRVDTMFRGPTRGEVVLGVAWAAPPASLQPALYEPPYSAMCLPCGRGEGSIADDVYALGVALVILALGRTPLAGVEERAVLQRKLALGSYEALVGGERLPPAIGDLVRGMLAEDPEHRPTPALLADPAAARARRVAGRARRRAQRPLEFGGIEAWDARVLAFAIAQHPEKALPAIRSGPLDLWLRRSLDAALAARLDDAIRDEAAAPPSTDGRAEAIMATRLVALLDPLSPLCWQGVAWWPDGLGPALAVAEASDPPTAGKLAASLAGEAAGAWAAVRPERCDEAALRVEARQHRALLRDAGQAGGLHRLVYALNPLLPCGSRLLLKRMVARIADLLPALEAASATVDRKTARPVDAHTAAFIAARCEVRLGVQSERLASAGWEGALTQLRVLARLQAQLRPGPLPGLAAWLADQAEPILASWRNRPRRALVQERLQVLAVTGQLPDMLALLDDARGRAADAREAHEAARALARIDGELRRIAAGAGARSELARCFGQELAAGAGLAALVAVLLAAALA